ncbi:RpiB/LacA/LacB family sugar-phosphate isomerase [Bacillus licheniformis]|nr:RpiB/LacA/LacB family sugar-phosphate isomerase [Bacillus licheniformis]
MKVIIASDHGGINIRKEIMALMDELNIEYEDYGCECGSGSVDYPDYAFPVAQKWRTGKPTEAFNMRNRNRHEHFRQ